MEDAEKLPVFRDRWGEATSVESPAREVAARRRRPWLVAAIVLPLILAGSYFPMKYARVQSLSQSCREALDAGDWGRVEDLAARWRFWDRSTAAPLVYLAEAASQTKQYDQAVAWLGELPDDDPMTPAALVSRSSILFEALNQPVEGAATLERALKIQPKITEAWRRLIYFYAFTLQRHRMVECAYAAIHHDCDLPETYVYLMLSDCLSFANAYEQNTKWLRGNPDAELFQVARALYRIKTKALDVESEAQTDGPSDADGTPYHQKIIAEHLRTYPGNLELVAYAVERAMTKGDVEEVARLLSLAPAESAQDNRFWRCQGWLHGIRGELKAAEACYQKALALVPYDHRSRHFLASIERRLKRLDLVKPLEDLSFEGKQLRTDLLRMPTIDKVPVPMLKRMSAHARRCGDDTAANKLAVQVQRLEAAENTSK